MPTVDVREVEAATPTPRSRAGAAADQGRQGPPRLRTRAAFWVLGLCNNYGYVVMISAAYDILHKNFLAEVLVRLQAF